MKRFVHWTVSMLLVLVTLLSLLPAAHAAQLNEIQRAVVATALAYFDKGTLVQYDSQPMTAQNRIGSGTSRMCSGDSPEMAAKDHTLYSVCSDFCYDVYYDATGYELWGSPRLSVTANMSKATTDDPICVYRWNKNENGEDTGAKAEKEAYAIIQPGDLIVGSNSSGGHAMLYAGDCLGDGTNYIIHCTGKKVDLTTGEDAVEAKGAIRMDKAGAYCFGETPGKGLHDKYSTFVILRPWMAKDFAGHTPTDHAKTRLQYPRLRIDKEADLTVYNSPVTGQDITVTLTAYNRGEAAIEKLPVTEYLPQGATLKDAGGAATAAGTLTWQLDIPAGKSQSVSYTVTVTAKRGEYVTIPAGKVGGLDTRSMRYLVSGAKLNGKALAALTALTKTTSRDVRAQLRLLDAKDANFAGQVYRELLGLDVHIPLTLNEITKDLFHRVTPSQMLSSFPFLWELNKEADIPAESRGIYDMRIPEHFGGYAVYIGDNPAVPAHTMHHIDRTTDYRAEFYEPGDIFIALGNADKTTATSPDNVDVFICLGGGKVLARGKYGAEVHTVENTIGLALKYHVVLGLRPSLAYDDVNAQVASLPFTDVAESDWFYPFVKELYYSGTVNGTTETTYTPSGTLTYGQALKLIVCAMGFDEQSPTDEHWASGYLQFAKRKGWISGEIALDAGITRKAFCQAAAKAARLAAQPAENPFRDTDDPAVLALQKAGVINGMTTDTFAPDAGLTRAQITKIICALKRL